MQFDLQESISYLAHQTKKTMSKLLLACTFFILASCQQSKKTLPESSLIGTWLLLTGTTIENGDTTTIDYTQNRKGIKIINETHFSFLQHDLTQGKDSLKSFSSGGGPYTLTGNKYKEHLEYCNYREWENHDFEFTVTITGDTLIQEGIERIESIGVDRLNIERYVRVR